ncbi:MAG: glucosaminidase domain-containing protein [Bacteroidales bacterium]
MRKKMWLFLIICSSTLIAQAQQRNKNYIKYIEVYKEIAIEHSKKYSIPASITLAQGLLESGAGQSRLAREGNNHFGIKCHEWTGRRIYHDDDAKNECFRRYRHAEESYEDHAKFLTNRSRYSFLFGYETTDYKSWAKGLSKAGYATDRTYPTKLIKIIEDYNLYEYDLIARGKNIYKFNHETFTNQGLLYVEAFPLETIEIIAKEFHMSAKKIRSYNDIPKNYQPQSGEPIYLQKKRSKAKLYTTHTVQGGESMHTISQKYGIKLKYLYKLNKKEFDYAPQAGEIIKLR